MSFSVPMLGKGISPAKAWVVLNPSTIFDCFRGGILESAVLSQCGGSFVSSTLQPGSIIGIAIIKSRFPIVESLCVDPVQWRIEQILSKSIDLCSRHFEGKRCNAKIAKYHHPVAAPTFTRVEKQSKSRDV